jgi:hypothetical protein
MVEAGVVMSIIVECKIDGEVGGLSESLVFGEQGGREPRFRPCDQR